MVSNIKQQKNNWRSTRDGFGEAMLELGKKNKEVVVVSADLAESTRVQPFAKKYHERFFYPQGFMSSMAMVSRKFLTGFSARCTSKKGLFTNWT